ncbi:MAG: transporter substrate-binding domain-containing protein [Methanoregula sp.]|nr:transporter substrate-binding domain-containing protein [Methanoregula sp.]
MTRGTLVIASQTAYPPWSDYKPGGNRTTGTKCAPNELTAGELTGFDVDVAVEMAHRLGVEPCFVTPPRTLVFSGNWADAWDIGIGSITITSDRMKVLYFTQPYKTTPSRFFVLRNNTAVSRLGDLSGKKIGVCAGCIQEQYLQGVLQIPGQDIDFVVENATIVAYNTDTLTFPDLAAGNLDAALVNEGIGLSAIRNGSPVTPLEKPAFYAPIAAVVDKNSVRDPLPFVRKMNAIVQDMHRDGTLTRIIQSYYPNDLTKEAAGFNISALQQYS